VIVTQVWYQWHRVWIYVALLIPLAVAVTAALAKVRPSRSWRRSIAEVGMVFGTLPWAWMILTPMQLPPGSRTRYLIPFSDLRMEWGLGRPGWMVVQVLGNLLVLFALGAFAPVRFPFFASLGRLALLGAAVSLTLELLQHAFVAGRVFSMDDVWLNALGCVLGGLVTRPRWRRSEST
jgi:glycopeptide antibiotics resistance protein